jgi:hypothetical protein
MVRSPSSIAHLEILLVVSPVVEYIAKQVDDHDGDR